MRRLASIQTVTLTEPIPNADAIERVKILGWWVVCKKGEYRLGDRVVYCEIDSLLPERPEFEFLRASSFKAAVMDGDVTIQRAGFRIKTVKLREQVSQGICFPLSMLSPGAPIEIGSDVTSDLDIIKYEPPIPVGMGGRIKGTFPAFLSKTDEIRIQVLEPILERYRGQTFQMTEKLDGSSMTAFLRDGEFGICSRNQWLDEADETNVMVRVAKTLDLPGKLARIQNRFGFQPAIQGEVIGPGIQKNKYGLDRVDLRVFNIFDIGQYRLIDRSVYLQALVAVELMGVPELGPIVLDHTIDQLVELSIGVSTLQSKTQREGIVFRPDVEQFDQDVGGRLSFKVINPQFLLKYDE
ncbi:MAG: ligase [Schlesneria sp.]|nr:ligase [Schlesneria sp.]